MKKLLILGFVLLSFGKAEKYRKSIFELSCALWFDRLIVKDCQVVAKRIPQAPALSFENAVMSRRK